MASTTSGPAVELVGYEGESAEELLHRYLSSTRDFWLALWPAASGDPLECWLSRRHVVMVYLFERS